MAFLHTKTDLTGDIETVKSLFIFFYYKYFILNFAISFVVLIYLSLIFPYLEYYLNMPLEEKRKVYSCHNDYIMLNQVESWANSAERAYLLVACFYLLQASLMSNNRSPFCLEWLTIAHLRSLSSTLESTRVSRFGRGTSPHWRSML